MELKKIIQEKDKEKEMELKKQWDYVLAPL